MRYKLVLRHKMDDSYMHLILTGGSEAEIRALAKEKGLLKSHNLTTVYRV